MSGKVLVTNPNIFPSNVYVQVSVPIIQRASNRSCEMNFCHLDRRLSVSVGLTRGASLTLAAETWFKDRSLFYPSIVRCSFVMFCGCFVAEVAPVLLEKAYLRQRWRERWKVFTVCIRFQSISIPYILYPIFFFFVNYICLILLSQVFR